MKKRIFNILAKILSILYIILITLFALDTKLFSLGFLIHLIPTIILIICLFFAWSKPKIGGILFMLAGIGTMIFFNTYKELIPFIIITIIPLLIGILFWFNKKS